MVSQHTTTQQRIYQQNELIDDRLTPLLKHANELGKSHLLENKKARQRQWTPEKRAKQSKIINDNKPWRQSTGAKTQKGKRISAQNAFKHGGYSRECLKLKAVLKQFEQYRRAVHAQTWETIRIIYDIRAKTRAMTQPTLLTLTKETHAFLKEQGMTVSIDDVKRMVKQATGLSESDYITTPDKEILQEQIDVLQNIVDRRVKGEPLTRIAGETEFWGLPFKVTPDVLDPRADTETLVEAVLKKYPDKNAALKILDLGTGTGCIPIALLTQFPNAIAYAVEYSHAAAQIARSNAVRNDVADRFHIVQGDWMDALQPQSFDIITSNPPYIEESDIENLMPEVKNHDPVLALSGGKNGLDCYKKIIYQLKNHLKKDGAAFLEIGFGQQNDVARLVDDSNLLLCDSVADIQGIQRVVEIRNGDK